MQTHYQKVISIWICGSSSCVDDIIQKLRKITRLYTKTSSITQKDRLSSPPFCSSICPFGGYIFCQPFKRHTYTKTHTHAQTCVCLLYTSQLLLHTLEIVLKNIHIFLKSNEIRWRAKLFKQNIGSRRFKKIIFGRLVHW